MGDHIPFSPNKQYINIGTFRGKKIVAFCYDCSIITPKAIVGNQSSYDFEGCYLPISPHTLMFYFYHLQYRALNIDIKGPNNPPNIDIKLQITETLKPVVGSTRVNLALQAKKS